MRCRGVTLIELVVAVAVLALIAAFAAPSFGSWLERQQAVSAHNALLGSLQFARAHAITAGQRTVMCKSGDGRSCAQTGSWNQGWLIFEDFGSGTCTDSTGDGLCDEDGGRILRVHEGVPARWIRVAHNQNIALRVAYPAHGTQRLNTNGTFTYCSVRNARVLGGTVVAPSGRVRRAEQTDPSLGC